MRGGNYIYQVLAQNTRQNCSCEYTTLGKAHGRWLAADVLVTWASLLSVSVKHSANRTFADCSHKTLE